MEQQTFTPTSAKSTTPWGTQAHLANVGVFVPLERLAQLRWGDRLEAVGWATAVAEDGENTIAERPEWLPARDSIATEPLLAQDHERHGGREQAMARFHDQWAEPAPEPEPAPARSFLDELDELDEDMARDLAAVGVNLEDPTANDDVHLQLLASRLLRSAALDEAEIDQNKAAEALEIALIRRSYAESRGVLERRREWTLGRARDVAEHLNYGKKKSLALPYGTIGYTNYAEKAKVTDSEAALGWATEQLPSAVTTETIVRRTLDTKAIAAHRLETGEDIPGVDVTPARTEFYARPKLPAELTAGPASER